MWWGGGLGRWLLGSRGRRCRVLVYLPLSVCMAVSMGILHGIGERGDMQDKTYSLSGFEADVFAMEAADVSAIVVSVVVIVAICRSGRVRLETVDGSEVVSTFFSADVDGL